VQFEDNPAGQLEGWMKASYQAKIPGARFDGAGAAIMAMVAAEGWNDRSVDKQLGLVAQQPSTFYDRVKWKTAKLHLSKGFTVSVRTYTGKAVDGDAFPNHLGGMADPP